MEHPRARFEADACAAALLQAWRSGEQLQALAPGLRPATLGQGYDAQDRLIATAGDARAGWKLGVGSPAQMRAGGLSRPLVGQVLRSRCHADGALAENVEHACVTFEVVRSRFVDRRAVGWPSFAADNVGFEALIVGAPLPVARIRDVNDSAEVRLDGEPAARAQHGDDATDPLASLQALFDHAGERGITLRKGEIVSTGAMCRPFDVRGGGHRLTATFLSQQLSFEL